MDNSINISLSEREAGISEVRVDGVIDTITASELERVIDSLIKRKRYKIVIDLAGVEYISSAGWGIFISQIKEVRANEGDIKLANMIENVQEIYELLEFENVLRAYDSLDSARSDFGTAASSGVKKKEPKTTRLTVIDQVETAESDPIMRLGNDSGDIGSGDLESLVVNAVIKDPFATISEVCKDLNRRLPTERLGWWRVFGVLRRHKLLSRRSRFRHSRRFYHK